MPKTKTLTLAQAAESQVREYEIHDGSQVYIVLFRTPTMAELLELDLAYPMPGPPISGKYKEAGREIITYDPENPIYQQSVQDAALNRLHGRIAMCWDAGEPIPGETMDDKITYLRTLKAPYLNALSRVARLVVESVSVEEIGSQPFRRNGSDDDAGLPAPALDE